MPLWNRHLRKSSNPHATLRSQNRRSNQLSYAAARNYYYLLYKQTFSEKSIHNRKQSFVTHLHKIVSVFKKSTQKCNTFCFKVAKSHSAAGCFALRCPVFMYYSYTALSKKYPQSKLHVFQ